MAAELVAGVDDETAGNTTKTMQIFVILPRPGSLMNPNTISLEVSSSDTVATLKARLEGIDADTQYVRPIPPRQQRLVFAGTALPDDKTLADLGVGDSSTLQLVATQMAVYVRDLSLCHNSIRLLRGLSSTDTVDTLKARYEAATGGHIPADRQRLKYDCREMRNGTTLADCGVQDEAMVLVDRLWWHHTDAARALSRVLVVKVCRTDTVRRVKEVVEAAFGVPVAAQRAYRNEGPDSGYTDVDLEDGRTMEELGIIDWPHDPVLHPPFVCVEYRLDHQAGAAADEGHERPAWVPGLVFRGSHEVYNKIHLRQLLARKENPYWRPPVTPPSSTRLLRVFLGARDPLLP